MYYVLVGQNAILKKRIETSAKRESSVVAVLNLKFTTSGLLAIDSAGADLEVSRIN